MLSHVRALESAPLDRARPLDVVARAFEQEMGEGVVRVDSVKGRQQRLEVPYPEGMPIDVCDRDALDTLDPGLAERAGRHLEPLAGCERVLPGVRLFRAPDREEKRIVRSRGPDRPNDAEVPQVERLEPPD